MTPLGWLGRKTPTQTKDLIILELLSLNELFSACASTGFKQHLLLNGKSDWAETWWEASELHRIVMGMGVLAHFSRGSHHITHRRSQHPHFYPPLEATKPTVRATMSAIKRHLRWDSSSDRALTVLSFRRKGDQLHTTMNNMPKGFNTCNWLAVSSTEHCGKSCLSDFRKVHLVKLGRGTRSQPCRGCGIGVTNKLGLCYPCGYRREWCRANKEIQREFVRLAAIEILI